MGEKIPPGKDIERKVKDSCEAVDLRDRGDDSFGIGEVSILHQVGKSGVFGRGSIFFGRG